MFQAETPVPPPIPARTRVGSVRSRPPIPPPRPQNQASGSSTSTNSTSSTGTTSSGGTGRKTPPPAYSELYPARRYSSERLGPPPRPSPPGRKLSEGCLPSNRKNSTGASPLRPSPLEAAARTVDQPSDPNTSPITKSHSTPASLQTIVRFHSGSTMSLHHKVIISFSILLSYKLLNRIHFFIIFNVLISYLGHYRTGDRPIRSETK